MKDDELAELLNLHSSFFNINNILRARLYICDVKIYPVRLIF